jgi:hypothetical protein
MCPVKRFYPVYWGVVQKWLKSTAKLGKILFKRPSRYTVGISCLQSVFRITVNVEITYTNSTTTKSKSQMHQKEITYRNIFISLLVYRLNCVVRGHSNNAWHSREELGGQQNFTQNLFTFYNTVLVLLEVKSFVWQQDESHKGTGKSVIKNKKKVSQGKEGGSGKSQKKVSRIFWMTSYPVLNCTATWIGVFLKQSSALTSALFWIMNFIYETYQIIK